MFMWLVQHRWLTTYTPVNDGRSIVLLDDGLIASGIHRAQRPIWSTHSMIAISKSKEMHEEEGPPLAANSHTEALDRIEVIIAHEKIDRVFQQLDGYLLSVPLIQPKRWKGG